MTFSASQPPRITNASALVTSRLRRDVIALIEAGLARIHTPSVLSQYVSYVNGQLRVKNFTLSLQGARRVVFVGIGKCAFAAACFFEDLLGDRLTDGFALDVEGDPSRLQRIRFVKGDHPFPTETNVSATQELCALLEPLGKDDVVIFVISGGGSTLLCSPTTATCQQEEAVLKCLFAGGATIDEINTIRKHLSRARGGNLARYAYPARCISLIFSDVPGNDMSVVASGPTIRDTTTVADAELVIAKYNVRERCGLAPETLIETPKDEKYFERVTNVLLVSNALMLEAIQRAAEERGYTARIITDTLSGEARVLGEQIARAIADASSGTALLYGGETQVKIQGSGIGGRNQELTLAALLSIAPRTLVSAFATDGWDNTPHAGAIADTKTLAHANAKSLSPETFLKNNDSFTFFTMTGDYLETGKTGANVADCIIALRE